ncbi:MAG: glycoside hydrolase family 3 C-terminal domain-containing protein, partial [Xanthomonadales bacterium]|nr:glycoside hydrolase family 3 C-terminal domain-containing protein [Xanthomonadales bacterium]
QPKWPMPVDAELEARVDALLASLTLEEKVGQIIQGDIASLTPEDLRTYRLGSILAGGNSDPGGRYNATPAEWLALADAFWAESMDSSDGRKAIPVLFGIDAVHGQSNIVGATLFPHNVGLGATRNVELIRQIGRITAIETRTTGMEWTFAPTVAVPQDDRWGRTYEGYAEHPEVVRVFAPAMVEGLQGMPGSPEFLDERHVMTSVKHYLGDGGTQGGRDQGDNIASEADLRDIHAAGYITAIEAGAQAVMASYNSYHGTKMHGHRALLTDVLKGRMNFGGFVVGDWNGHGQVAGCTPTDCLATYTAGLDLAMAPDSWKGLYESTLAHAREGRLPLDRLDDAVRRILRVKFRLGLFEAPRPSERALGGQFELLGSAEHRAVARQAVRESLVLLKNAAGLLPLDPRGRILVAGDGAHDLSKQSGGWTLTWQGSGTTRADYPNADSIWEGLRDQIEAAGGEAELAVDGQFKQKPDAAIVVFGENPYAEFQGDLPNLAYRPGDDHDLQLLRSLSEQGIPTVAVFLSGRPLWVNREINAAQAFVAAWLPGSEGGGVADVLLRNRDGAVQHDFKGKLSYSWPRRADQSPLNVGQSDYDPQFAYGFGLSYADDGALAALSEDSGLTDAGSGANQFLVAGAPAVGLQLLLLGADEQAVVVSAPQASTADGALSLSSIDHEKQEGARLLVWQGKARMALLSQQPLDLDRETNGDVLLVVTLRVDALPADVSVDLQARSGGTQVVTLPLTATLSALDQGVWTRIGIPLKCLRTAGADTAALDVPFALQASAGVQIALADVRAATDHDQLLACPTQ